MTEQDTLSVIVRVWEEAPLNIYYPTGPRGPKFAPDQVGTLAGRAAFDARAEGFAYLASDQNPQMLYFRQSATPGVWSAGVRFAEPGSVWRSGAGVPAGSLGQVGDWYLNETNGDVYEKTGASAYTLRDNLTGPQGPPGSGGSSSDASLTTKGITKLSSAPAVATDPIAVGENDGRVPSQGENDALQGTSGTPSGANRFVTNDDTRNANARTPSDGSVTNAKVASDAAIAESKLTLASDAPAGTASRRTLGTGSQQAAAGNHSHVGGSGGVDVQLFTASGTWTKPDGCVAVSVICQGGGGGGGSGRRGAAGTVRAGGGGGGGGARTEAFFPASALGATEAVVAGAGGAGGAARTTDSTNGATGSDGGASSFGTSVTLCRAEGGPGGFAGAAASHSGSAAPATTDGAFVGSSGGGVTTTSGSSPPAAKIPGGGGGGVMGSANGAGGSGNGGASAWGLAGANAPSTGSGTSGSAGASRAGSGVPGGGGSGGAMSLSAAGGAGGSGGDYGAGAGGGAASVNGFDSGAGGTGGAGCVLVISHLS